MKPLFLSFLTFCILFYVTELMEGLTVETVTRDDNCQSLLKKL
jgi:hypothetical protein